MGSESGMFNRLFTFDSSTGKELSGNARLAWWLVVFLVPFQLHYNYIINAFYHFGAPYFDAGLFCQLLWHNDWRLMNPLPRGDFSYFGVHFSPFLLLVSQLSYLLPTDSVEFFAGFIASIYAALALAMFYALQCCVRPRSHWRMLLLALLAIGFSFNGFVAQGMWMPHFEYAIPLCIFLFLLHRARGNTGLAILFFVLALSLREDAGLHIAVILGLLIFLRYREQRSFHAIRKEVYFLIAACNYSALAWIIMSHVQATSNVGGVLTFIYTGNPPFAHLSWTLLWDRAVHIIREKSYLWLSMLVTLAWAWRTCNPYLAVGFVACLPWLLINWMAINGNTGALYAYYAFPFVLSMGWPVLALLWQYPLLPPSAVRSALGLQTILVLTGLVLWNGYSYKLNFAPVVGAQWGSYWLQENETKRALIREFVIKLHAGEGKGALGRVGVDQGIQSLTMGPFQGRDLQFIQPKMQSADTLVYFTSSYQPWGNSDIIQYAREHHLSYHYCIVGTMICLDTIRTREELQEFSSMLITVPIPANAIPPATK